MNNFLRQVFKITTLIFVITISIIILYNKQIVKNNIAIVTENKQTKAKQIEYCSGSKIKELFTNDEEKVTTEKNITTNQNILFNSKIELNLKDQAKPYNIENVDTKIIEDYMIINFDKPEDKGTNYLYKIQNRNQEKDISFYIKTDIKGYGYIINNSKNGEAPYEINKMDSSSILLEKLDWNNDYYLHIRSFDGDNNYSESKTIKLDLPSEGVSINYVDASTNESIKTEEKIMGVARQEYNINNENKKIEGYTLINIDGNTNGFLKKEKINVKYEYAKNITTRIKYIDKETKNEISEETIIEGYEGKQITITPKNINGYTTNYNQINEKMSEDKKEIDVYYDKIPQEIEGNDEMNLDDINDDNESLIDELINSLNNDELEDITKNNNTTNIENSKVKEEYEIVMNCDDSDYIIYYKK